MKIPRRDFVRFIGGAAALPMFRPIATLAQQPTIPVIGYLNTGSPERGAIQALAFRQGLSDIGYVEGRTVSIEYRWAEGQYDRLPGLAADLVRRQVAVVVAGGGPSARAAKAATETIPVVFLAGLDPVKSGLVASLNRPGGNVTGVTNISNALVAKKLGLLHELVPTATVIAALVNPTNLTTETQSDDLQGAARALGVYLHFLNVSSERDFDAAFVTLLQQHCGGLVVTDDPFFTSRRDQIVALAARHAVPAIFTFREFAVAGGLMSYATSLTDMYRRAGIYTGRILKGEKPADLPVVQPTKFEFVINLKTAKMLGLDIPPTLLAIADEVIE